MPSPVNVSRDDCVARCRDSSLEQVRHDFEVLLAWMREARHLPLHTTEAGLLRRLAALAVALLAWWSTLNLPDNPTKHIIEGGTHYSYRGWTWKTVRTRFGPFSAPMPAYDRIAGKGPERLFPGTLGLAAGSMSLGVHLLAAQLVSRMPFDDVGVVAEAFGQYVPGKRALLGVADRLGAQAQGFLENLPVPENDGDILVIEVDGKGFPHMTPKEHELRRRPHKKKMGRRGRTRAERRRARRGHRALRERRRQGDKSKNARMATVVVLYTLRSLPDGGVEGPLNRQVMASMQKHPKELFRTARKQAIKRGYGTKKCIYLADGALPLWNAWRQWFSQATPCLDWYHLSEYLWPAAGAVFRGKKAKDKRAAWVWARQDELLNGQVDKVLDALQDLHARIGRTGPGTKTRREAVESALRYIENHRDFLNYKDLQDLVIGTGNVEGAVKQLAARLDGAGMRWSKERSEAVLALRCVLLSGEWDTFSRRVIEAHESSPNLVVPRISPLGPMTPHNAVRKAA